jgi:hypothetical protein
MASRVVEVRNAVAAWLTEVILQNAPGTAVVATSRRIEIDDQVEDTTPAGRQVFVYPRGYGQVEAETRNTDLMEFRIGIIVVERYADPGVPPDSWVDDLSAWVEAWIYSPLNVIGVREDDQPTTDEELWAGFHCETADVLAEYDLEALTEHKIFWSELEFAFREES